jgi:5'-phosphate synthase pdxT subunit
MKVGVLALQGDVSEHVAALQSALRYIGKPGEILEVRKPSQVKGLGALMIPGGESTAISKQAKNAGIMKEIVVFAKAGGSIMGTCAGSILLASEVDGSKKIQTLSLMSISVKRNAFGRQRESFEMALEIDGIDGEFPGIFIRAPVISKVWGKAKALARIEEGIVMARQDNLLALTFHPELAHDNRIHLFFLETV